MARRHRRTDWRIEAVEARVLLTPTPFAGVTLPGANSGTAAWDYSQIGGAASPLMADVTNDGLDEVIVVAPDRQIHAYSYDTNLGTASLVRTYAISPAFNAGVIMSTPVVATLPGGGKAIFAGTYNGQVWGWNAHNGQPLHGWPRPVGYDAPPGFDHRDKPPGPILGHVAAGDLDGDAIPEIVVTSFNEFVTAYNFDGSMRWRYSNDESIYGGVVIADLQGDGSPEVVFGGDSQAVTAFYRNGGRLTALTSDGRRAWVKQTDQVIWSSPTAVDLNGDGTLEIVVGTGFFFPQPNPDAPPFPGNRVYAVDHQGNDVPGWPFVTEFNPNVDARVFSSPAAADLDGDGFLDIVVTDNREIMTAISGRPGDYQLRAGYWQPRILWQVQAFDPSASKIYTSPIVVDINGDGRPDVVQADGNGYLRGFDGQNGAQISQYTDDPRDGLGHQYLNALAVGKFKPGGQLQMAAAPITTNLASGRVLWPGNLVLFDLPASAAAPPWPQFRNDAGNNAVARPDAFLRPLITRLYAAALGRIPLESEIQAWLPVFRHAASLAPGATAIISSPEARARLVDGWFVKYLGIHADQGAINQYSAAMRAGTSHAVLQRDILASDYAFHTVNGGNSATWVRYLYQRVLGRTANDPEVSAWVGFLNARGGGGNLPARQQVAGALVGSFEFTVATVQRWYRDFLGNVNPPVDAVYAASWDLRRGRQEENVLRTLIAANGDYVAAQGEGAWIRGLFQDVLQRSGSPAEIAQYLQALERGVSMRDVAATFVYSVEYRQLYVRAWFQQLLSRAPTAAELQSVVAGLGGGLSRAQFLSTLAASDEYFARAGGTLDGFVHKVFRDFMKGGEFASPTPDATALDYWRTRAAQGENVRVTLPQNVLGGGYAGGYFRNVINSWFYQYLRRLPNTPAHQGRILETNPNANYGAAGLLNHLLAGGNEIDVQIAVLTSHEYINMIARKKGFWNGQRWLA